MPDDFRRDDNPDEDWNQDDEQPDVPASVTFMEMMRQAAARRAPEQPPEPLPQPPPQAAPENAAPEPEAVTPPDATPQRVPPPQPVRRVRRRSARRARTAVGVIGGFVRAFLIVMVAAGLSATIFTWWTNNDFIPVTARAGLSIAIATDAATPVATPLSTPNWARRIGIVSGHRGNDSGAVCPDGLTEAEINLSVAQLVVRNLRSVGYTVDLLDEFDPRLQDYHAEALVSIHANSCQDYGEPVSGFLVAAAMARISARGDDNRLVSCIAQHYAAETGLSQHEGLTEDMTNYHAFREIHAQTPAAIVELGFMLGDRQILTEQPDTLARGITDGIRCYLEPGSELR